MKDKMIELMMKKKTMSAYQQQKAKEKKALKNMPDCLKDRGKDQ